MTGERDGPQETAPDVVAVTGMLEAGETTRALAYVKGRNGLSPRWRLVMLLCSMIAVGVPVGKLVSGSWLSALLTVEFTIVGLIGGALLFERVWIRTMRKALVERGQPTETRLTFRLAPDGPAYDLEALVMTARWDAVTDLFRTRHHWIFLAQGGAMVLPRRFFATPEAERAFIAAAVARMSEPARGRSPDAVALAQG